MFIPKIPNNSLTKEITEIVQLSKKLENDYNFEYNPPATEDEISTWENEHGITIPETYKDWLRFSNGSAIRSELAVFWGVRMIGSYGQFLPNDLVTIGEMIGDGEFLCFSKKTGKIIWEDHGNIDEYDSFNTLLTKVIPWIEGKTGLSQSSIDVLMSMVKASKNNEEKN